MNLKRFIIFFLGAVVIAGIVIFGFCALAYCRIFPKNTIFIEHYNTKMSVNDWIKQLRLW